MKPTSSPKAPSESTPDYYTYQSADSGPLIHLSLDALDEMLSEVMTGFGSIPRRGMEIGGILLGRTRANEIRVESFLVVECEHRRGPSYLLSEQDQIRFDSVVKQPHEEGQSAVGLFRSNTREQNAIADDDRGLFAKYFQPPSGIFLLVRPYASKSSVGMFVVPRDGVLPDSNPDVFPFQRWELSGGSAPRRRALTESRTQRPDASPDPEGEEPRNPESQIAPARPPELQTPGAFARARGCRKDKPERLPTSAIVSETQQDLAIDPPKFEQGSRRAWHWIPLSLIFLLLGILLGFQSALTFYPREAVLDKSTFALGLIATLNDNSLHIKWNREAPAIRLAERGRLDIQDGNYNRIVDLDASSLQTGSVVYPPASPNVTLRLQVSLKGNNSAMETLVWSK